METRIHITGASGFIGSELFKYLKMKKYNVIGYSRKKNSKLTKISSYNNIKGSKNDILIHLAQFSNTKKKIKNNEIIKNIKISKNLSTSIWKHIIYVSSTNLYQNSKKIKSEKTKIDYNIFKNRNDFYSLIKAKSEKIFLEKGASVLRLSNVYGKKMSQNSLFMNIIKQLKNKEIVVDDERPIRDYIFIEDILYAIELFINKNQKGIYNINYGKSYSVKEIVYLIFKILNVKKKLRSKDLLTSNAVYVDNNKLYKSFKWKPNINLEKGLKKILNEK